MNAIKRILTSLMVFLLGLEVGAFGMWCLITNAVNDSSQRRRKTSSSRVSYADYRHEK